jgi:hypothetical protein
MLGEEHALHEMTSPLYSDSCCFPVLMWDGVVCVRVFPPLSLRPHEGQRSGFSFRLIQRWPQTGHFVSHGMHSISSHLHFHGNACGQTIGRLRSGQKSLLVRFRFCALIFSKFIIFASLLYKKVIWVAGWIMDQYY